MITEEEARKKWCPYAFTFGQLMHGKDHTNHSYGPQNRGFQMKGALLPTCSCIASECMAWLWADRDEIHVPEGAELPPGYIKKGRTVISFSGQSRAYTVCALQRCAVGGEPIPMRGYCGLAGKP